MGEEIGVQLPAILPWGTRNPALSPVSWALALRLAVAAISELRMSCNESKIFSGCRRASRNLSLKLSASSRSRHGLPGSIEPDVRRCRREFPSHW